MTSSAMMTLLQVQAWLPSSRLVGDGAVAVGRVHTDTRTLLPGDLFVALRGDTYDGGAFLAQAAEKGAVAAICEPGAEPLLAGSGMPGLVVPDAKRALGALAKAWRGRFTPALIAVTGSNGKTTVTQMIASILRAWKGDAALATQGNFNNDIGVPLTLLRLRSTHQAAVIELGMNHPGEIAVLADMAAPTVALVNNAQREHLEFMGSVEAVARENGQVIAALGRFGTAVFPSDDAYTPVWTELTAHRPRLTFSDAAPSADIRGSGTWQGKAWQVNAHTPAGPLAFRLAVAGRHNVRNALAAATCALAVGVPLDAIGRGLEAFEPVKGRSRALSLNLGGHALTVVDDSYNANPDSVRAAIEVLAELPAPRLLVLGDMGEVGEEGPGFHAEVGALARDRGLEQIFTLGTLAEHVARQCPAARHFSDMPDLLAAVQDALPGVGSVVVKGSRFMTMERVVDAIVRLAGEQQGGGVHVA